MLPCHNVARKVDMHTHYVTSNVKIKNIIFNAIQKPNTVPSILCMENLVCIHCNSNNGITRTSFFFYVSENNIINTNIKVGRLGEGSTKSI